MKVKSMLHVAMQLEDKEELHAAIKLLNENLGVLPFEDFDRERSGFYIMSTDMLTIKDIEDYSDEEIQKEFERRDLEL